MCLFICATTRVAHLELVKDLTTHQFLFAIHGFSGAASTTYFHYAKTFSKKVVFKIF